jgi:hypothetical protein
LGVGAFRPAGGFPTGDELLDGVNIRVGCWRVHFQDAGVDSRMMRLRQAVGISKVDRLVPRRWVSISSPAREIFQSVKSAKSVAEFRGRKGCRWRRFHRSDHVLWKKQVRYLLDYLRSGEIGQAGCHAPGAAGKNAVGADIRQGSEHKKTFADARVRQNQPVRFDIKVSAIEQIEINGARSVKPMIGRAARIDFHGLGVGENIFHGEVAGEFQRRVQKWWRSRRAIHGFCAIQAGAEEGAGSGM